MKSFRDKLAEIVTNGEEINQIISLIKKDLIGKDEDVKEAVIKDIPYPNALIYRNEVRHWMRRKLESKLS